MEGFFDVVNTVITTIDDFVWGVPLMVLILFGGILLTVRLAVCSSANCRAHCATWSRTKRAAPAK